MEKNKYSIKITPKAYDDLDDIFDYIANELYNDIAVEKLMGKIETNIMRLSEFPFSGSFVQDKNLKNKGYRKLVIENYIVFYIVNDRSKEVVIMRVLYGGRKYDDFI